MKEVDCDKLAMEVFDELNIARQVPNALISSISKRVPNFDNNTYKAPGAPMTIETYEGVKAVSYIFSFIMIIFRSMKP